MIHQFIKRELRVLLSEDYGRFLGSVSGRDVGRLR